MTAKQRRGFNWTVGIAVTLAGIIWGAAAWATDNDALDEQQSVDIHACEDKSVEALTISIENRTRAVIMAARVDELERRMDNLEAMQPLIEDIHEAVTGGR